MTGSRHIIEQLLALASDELRRPPGADKEPPDDGPAVIVTNGRPMHDITADALAALQRANGSAPFLLRRGNVPVRIVQDGAALPVAEPLSPTALKGILDRNAAFVVEKDAGQVPCRPPNDVVLDILALPAAPLPELGGILGAPVFLADGSLLSASGYHAGSGLYLALGDLEGVRSDLSAKEALAWLFEELLFDFPFADDGSRAHTLALLLQPFARPLIAGPTPLNLIDAPARGTGKGLLAEVAALVALGGPAPVMVPPRDDGELEKRITAILLEGSSLILLDNVSTLSAAPLAGVLTAEEWHGRLLGQSKMLRLQQRATWIATGNNVTLSDELARRVVAIRLNAEVERPEERTDFKHDPLPRWTRDHRRELVSSCLSLVQRWLDAGQPEGTEVLGRFECWARVMGGILGVAGVPGFLSGRDRLYSQSDTESEEWRGFCCVWWERQGADPTTAGELLALAKETTLLAALWGGRGDLAGAQRIGRALSHRRDRVYGAFTIRAAGRDGRTRNAVYRLERRGDTQNARNTRNTVGSASLDSTTAGPAAGVLPERGRQNTPANQANTRSEPNLRADVSGVSGVSQSGPGEGTWESEGQEELESRAVCAHCRGDVFRDGPGGRWHCRSCQVRSPANPQADVQGRFNSLPDGAT